MSDGPASAPVDARRAVAPFAWTLALLGALLVTQLVVAAWLATPGGDAGGVATGTQLAAAAFACVPVLLLGVALPAMLAGRSLADELALRSVRPRVVLAVVAATALLVATLTALEELAERPVPPFLLAILTDPGSLWLLVPAIVAAVPLYEELLFRGYLQGRLARVAGARAAVIVSAALFAATHVQYELFEMSLIAVVGLFLALLRWRTGSVWMPVLAHGLYNGASLVHAFRELAP